MDVLETWTKELDRPTEAFLPAVTARLRLEDGPRTASLEAIRHLVPRIAWAECHPHLPLGFLGLRAVWRLRPLLAEASFLRALATQLHMCAHEGRASRGRSLGEIEKGTGNLEGLDRALATHRGALAWGECLGLEVIRPEHFDRMAPWVVEDMSHLGHKAIFLHAFKDLHARLDHPKASGRRLLGLAAWMAAQEPLDTFWAQRAGVRLAETAPPANLPARLSESEHLSMAREICDLGLVALLDAWALHVKAGVATGDLLAALALAASEKLLDARRDLEGKTAWTLHHLASLHHFLLPVADGRAWLQAAALVNLFPTDEPEDRLPPRAPRIPGTLLLDAILDGEPQVARFLALQEAPEGVLQVLAEASTQNDPVFNHASQVMAIASAADLLPFLPPHAATALTAALAKSLANAQGSADLGRIADRGLREA